MRWAVVSDTGVVSWRRRAAVSRAAQTAHTTAAARRGRPESAAAHRVTQMSHKQRSESSRACRPLRTGISQLPQPPLSQLPPPTQSQLVLLLMTRPEQPTHGTTATATAASCTPVLARSRHGDCGKQSCTLLDTVVLSFTTTSHFSAQHLALACICKLWPSSGTTSKHLY